ncbi:MAG: 50S ribosomal protein L21 [Elusimicrobia bacterium]|nr:50S ribosomal protein L21 [Elusimicrobiota bacterium]
MYAIIETGGKQFWVVPGETIQVGRLQAEEGAVVTLPALWAAGSTVEWADTSALPKAKVTAQVLRHLLAPKVIVFKKRPKKAYQKTQGHRQGLTEIKIQDISLN